MMPVSSLGGSRLEFVVRKLPGHVEREVSTFKRGEGIVKEIVKQPAGFMVYFPKGHVLRMTEKELKARGLNRKPKMINLQGLGDPNSAVGKLMMAQDKEESVAAYADLERLVMQLATAKTGSILMPEQVKAIA